MHAAVGVGTGVLHYEQPLSLKLSPMPGENTVLTDDPRRVRRSYHRLALPLIIPSDTPSLVVSGKLLSYPLF